MHNAQLSHTHSIGLVGIASKIRYLLRLFMLVSGHNLWKTSIDALPAVRHVLML